MDLVERQTDYKNAENNVDIVLYWTTAEGGFGLEAVDDVAEKDLDKVEDEERESKTRMTTVEVGTATAGNDCDSKRKTNDDEGTGKQRLDGLMCLEPSAGRGPEVSRHQGSQGKEKQESQYADNTMGDDHPVGAG